MSADEQTKICCLLFSSVCQFIASSECGQFLKRFLSLKKELERESFVLCCSPRVNIKRKKVSALLMKIRLSAVSIVAMLPLLVAIRSLISQCTS